MVCVMFKWKFVYRIPPSIHVDQVGRHSSRLNDQRKYYVVCFIEKIAALLPDCCAICWLTLRSPGQGALCHYFLNVTFYVYNNKQLPITLNCTLSGGSCAVFDTIFHMLWSFVRIIVWESGAYVSHSILVQFESSTTNFNKYLENLSMFTTDTKASRKP